MTKWVMDRIIAFLREHSGITLDITGGCPEMHPDFRFFIEATRGLSSRRMLRSNLVIMTEPGMEWLPQFCRKQELVIIGSLPCYLQENVDMQRGSGAYDRSISALKRLNTLGYGDLLELDLVYNPGADFVAGPQKELEVSYKAELETRHGVIFNNLFTINNAPIGRFREDLERKGTLARYLAMLDARFNPKVAGSIMCRNLVSIDWEGVLYNCDFNQATSQPIRDKVGRVLTIEDLGTTTLTGTDLVLDRHCYSCTAGEGSSCTGALAV
jgi:radical SAM/Cys-rich protein